MDAWLVETRLLLESIGDSNVIRNPDLQHLYRLYNQKAKVKRQFSTCPPCVKFVISELKKMVANG